MSILMLILGFILGLGAKFGLDEYHRFRKEQEKTMLDMENILTNFKAIEKLKELEK